MILFAEGLPKRELFGRRFPRPQAQVVGSVVGLLLGGRFPLATG